MSFDPSAVNVINIILCAIIFIFGWWGYQKNKDKLILFIGIAFAFFGVSHVLTLFDLEDTLSSLLITIRLLAYMIVIVMIFKAAIKE